MALTVTSRGTGTHNTGATTLVPDGRSATLAVGSMGVLCISADNAGSLGATLMGPSSQADSKGNVWTLRQDALYDNGAASAGIEMLIYTAPITVALLTTDTLTLTWVAGVSPVAKVWTWYEVIPSGANTVAYSTGGTIAGATAANAQVTTASVLVGDAVIAGYFSENVAAVTGDSDSTNGTWTAQQTTTIGATTSGVRIASQQKVQTTSASTQSYDVTVSSQDRIAGYIMLHEVVNTTVTPGLVSLASSLFAPTVTTPNNQLVTPGLVSLALTAFAPSVAVTDHQLVTPGVATLATSTFTPQLRETLTPAPASLSLSAFAPVVAVSDNQIAVPSAAAMVTATFVPTITISDHQIAVPGINSLSLTAFAPSVVVTDHQLVIPGVAGLTMASFAPDVVNPQSATPATASLVLSPEAPSVSVGGNQVVQPGVASLSLTGFAPTVTQTQLVIPATGALTLTTFAPVVTASANQMVVPATRGLVLQGYRPLVTGQLPPAPPSAGHIRYGTDLRLRPLPKVKPEPVEVVPRSGSLHLTTFSPRVDVNDDEVVLALLLGIEPEVAVR
jgi:hypothetical protein